MDVNVSPGAGYGNTLVWAPGQQPGMGEILVEVQDDLDKTKFYKEFVELLSRPTPTAKNEEKSQRVITMPGAVLLMLSAIIRINSPFDIGCHPWPFSGRPY